MTMYRLALGLFIVLVSLTTAHAYTIVDFVTFNGIDYIRNSGEMGRPLERADLGDELAIVAPGSRVVVSRLPAGTRMYAVRGYAQSFRLAAVTVTGDDILLYQAWRGASAKVGSDLYDIRGRVQSIDVRREPSLDPAKRKAVVIRAKGDVDRLADMITTAPVAGAQARTGTTPWYWLTFWLSDGTTFGRGFFPETSQLTGGLTLPPEFQATIERHLND
jgi:hypothetical protein